MSSGTCAISRVHPERDAHLPEPVLMLEELGNGADGEEGLVLGRVLALGVEDVRADDGRQIGQIHLAARLLVDVGE